MARLGSAFSVIAALLAGIGLYGLLSYTLVQKSREIGIRMALGATPPDIVKATAVRTLIFVIVGVAAGLAASIGTAQLMRSLKNVCLGAAKGTDSFVNIEQSHRRRSLGCFEWNETHCLTLDPLAGFRGSG